jgi:hypothetical protein|tara:strand:- start:4268 stop:4540 length:273 start_codon:yes stop_codon:yes gene_type:complete
MTEVKPEYQSRCPIAEVLWEDSWIESSDFSIKEALTFKPVLRSTVGYLIEETDDCVILATDLYEKETDGANTPMVIPWSVILGYWEFDVH